MSPGRLNESRVSALLTDVVAASASCTVDASVHAKHAATVLVGIDGEVTVRAEREARGRVVVVPPDEPHAISAPGPVVQMLFDPELAPRVAAFARAAGGASALTGGLGERVRSAVVAQGGSITRAEVLSGVSAEAAGLLVEPSRRPDRRVAELIERLRYPVAGERVAVGARGVSEAHLRELFARDVGIPVRTFQLWRRLLMTLSHYGPLDTTEAAREGGFADLAHFTRTCRRMLGNPPTVIRARLLPR